MKNLEDIPDFDLNTYLAYDKYLINGNNRICVNNYSVIPQSFGHLVMVFICIPGLTICARNFISLQSSLLLEIGIANYCPHFIASLEA